VTAERKTGQPLWCQSCKRLHRFSPRDLEQIIYAAQAAHAEAEISEDDSPWLGESFESTVTCLSTYLSMARSVESYAEHVESLVASRTHAAKLDVERAARELRGVS